MMLFEKQLTLCSESHSYLIKDDPVRPHLSWEWRTTAGREVWLLENSGSVDAVICVAYTNAVPDSEQALDLMSQAAAQEQGTADTAVFYTVWSYSPGSGQQIVNGIARLLKQQRPQLRRWVTLSPLTEMAERFHIKNGAVLLARHSTCQNFDYTHMVLA